MIRSIYFLSRARTPRDFAALEHLFQSLGLTAGPAWQGRRNRGALFRAPQAAIEVALGPSFPEAEIVFEVGNADVAYDAARANQLKIVAAPEDTDWGARLFLVEAAGHRAAIYSYLPEKDHERVEQIEPPLDARGLRFGIVVARFNSFITDRLLAGALLALRQAGASNTDFRIVRVPGSFEIPAAARALAETGDYDAIICLGCLLRGETLHYEVIANEVTRGIGQSQQETGVPHGFGVLTCDTLEQAIDRAGLKAGNKGYEAALAAIEMANARKTIAAGKSSQRSTVVGRRRAAKKRRP